LSPRRKTAAADD
jgi:hypothetical protein